jgi:hypothetical protein
MLACASRGRFVIGPVDPGAVVRDSSGLVQAAIPVAARLVLELADGLPAIEADPNQARQVLINLVANAGEALPGGGGTVSVRTGQLTADAGYLAGTILPEAMSPRRCAFLETADDGAGITPAVARRMFEPCFTTRFPGRGLGLAAVLGIMRRHHGTLRVDTAPGGTTVRVPFPLAGALQSAPRPAAPAASARTTVLLVDDEANVLRRMRVFLQRAGFTVLTANSGEAVLAQVRVGPATVGLVILDLTMPGMGGAALRRADHPGLPAEALPVRRAGGGGGPPPQGRCARSGWKSGPRRTVTSTRLRVSVATSIRPTPRAPRTRSAALRAPRRRMTRVLSTLPPTLLPNSTTSIPWRRRCRAPRRASPVRPLPFSTSTWRACSLEEGMAKAWPST